MLNKIVYIFYPLKLHWYFDFLKENRGPLFKVINQIIHQLGKLSTTAMGKQYALASVELLTTGFCLLLHSMCST